MTSESMFDQQFIELIKNDIELCKLYDMIINNEDLINVQLLNNIIARITSHITKIDDFERRTQVLK